jgi:hypothetical protein
MGRSRECDFIKIDTQGSELDILHGGDALLDNPIIGLEVEVEFVRMYEEQPLFGDICSYLDKKGYEFIDFVNICRWEREKFSYFGQSVFGDGLFLRSPESFAEILSGLPSDIANQKAKNYISIVALYDHVDLLTVCLDCFHQFLSPEDIKKAGRLRSTLLMRRKFTGSLVVFANQVLKPFGMRFLGLQYK